VSQTRWLISLKWFRARSKISLPMLLQKQHAVFRITILLDSAPGMQIYPVFRASNRCSIVNAGFSSMVTTNTPRAKIPSVTQISTQLGA
jgi:hypothetical protein